MDVTKKKVLVALSGGVDSAVAAALLIEQGYEVAAAYMIQYDEPNEHGVNCWVGDYQDAVRVAATLGIPLFKFNFAAEYRASILKYLFREYEAGRTPNPDVLCNRYIKFGAWLEQAKKLGFNFLATGHYAQIKQGLLSHLLCAKDTNKDQTYFLHQLNQDQLAHTIFPIGGYTKPEVREIAKKFNLPVADKEESMGICFIGEVSMRDFLRERIHPKPGNVVLPDGKKVGEHDGVAFYTLGQRPAGLKITTPPRKGGRTEPLYVIGKDISTNELVVGYGNDPLLYKHEIEVANVHWISGQSPRFPLECQIRLRHRQPLQKCTVKAIISEKKEKIVVAFEKAERAPTPGQFAVFYKDNECLGGGTIN